MSNNPYEAQRKEFPRTQEDLEVLPVEQLRSLARALYIPLQVEFQFETTDDMSGEDFIREIENLGGVENFKKNGVVRVYPPELDGTYFYPGRTVLRAIKVVYDFNSKDGVKALSEAVWVGIQAYLEREKNYLEEQEKQRAANQRRKETRLKNKEKRENDKTTKKKQ